MAQFSTSAATAGIVPSAEDDHQSRLEDCKAYFVQLALTLPTLATENHMEVILNIRSFLFDRWSVIRFQCCKCLSPLLSKFALASVNALLQVLQEDFQERNRPWQELHGCLLGYTAVLSRVLADETALRCLVLDCLDVIGHIRNPIRDAAKDCMVKIGSHLEYRQGIVSQVLEMIRSLLPTPNNTNSNSHSSSSSSNGGTAVDSEANTLKIDGLLNVIVDLIPHMKAEITSSSTSSSHHTSDSLESLSLTMKQCFFHPASTVRQKAGSIVTSMVKLLLTPSTQTLFFSYLLSQVLIDTLQHHSAVDEWQGQEVCLMVCEEVLRDVTNQAFLHLHHAAASSQTAPQHAVWLQKVHILHQLMQVLQGLVHYFLAHPRFEVRRVVLQLLPTIARAKIILPPADSANTVLSSSSSSSGSNKVEQPQIEVAAGKASFEAMLDMVWLSMLMKEYRHLHEVLHPLPSSATGGSAVMPWPSMFGAEYWSNEVHGRLLEVELRQDFHKKIEQVLSHSDHGAATQSIRDSLVRCSQEILQLLETLIQQLDTIAKDGEVPNYVSMDFIEFFTLSQCFLFSLQHHSNAAFFPNHASLVQQVVVLRSQLDKYSIPWYKTLAFLQLNSVLQTAISSTGSQKSSSHLPLNVFSFGNSSSAARPTATEFIIMFLYQYHSYDASSTQQDRNSPWLQLKCNMGEFELEQVRLLPTLTDPATNPLIYTEEQSTTEEIVAPIVAVDPRQIAASSTTSMSSPQRSSLRIQVSSRENSFYPQQTLTPSSSSTKEYHVMSSMLSPGISAKSPSITSPNRVGVGCNVPVNSSMASYHSMNRWNCEAISPLLYVLSCQLYLNQHVEETMFLACITAEWLINILLDPLWLDNRKFARRVLMESLPILLNVMVQQDLETLSTSLHVMLLYLSRTLAEILTIESKQMAMDVRLFGPLLKASLEAISICGKLSLAAIRQVHQDVYNRSDRISQDYKDLLVQTIESFLSALEGLLEKQTSSVSFGGSSVNSSNVSKPGSRGGTPVKTTLFHQFEHAAADTTTSSQHATTGSNETEESDEFSDWDEDEEEETMNTADSCNSAAVLTNTVHLVKDMEVLIEMCLEWKRDLEENHSIEF